MEWPRDMANDNRRMRKDLEEAHAKIERLEAPWRAVDDMDWDYVMGSLGHGGRDRFWKAVLTEMRAALKGGVDVPNWLV